MDSRCKLDEKAMGMRLMSCVAINVPNGEEYVVAHGAQPGRPLQIGLI
jgi:hypothetical protein